VILRGNPAAEKQPAKSPRQERSAPISAESIKDLEEKVRADRKEMEEKRSTGRRLAPFIQERMEKRAARLAELQKSR